MPVILVFITALAIAGQTQPTLKPELTALTFFQGAWSCDGKFSKDNRKISSDMAFQPDLEGAWLMVRHDDRPPNAFHLMPSMPWNSGVLTRRQASFVAVVNDSFGGMQIFTSPGWQENRLTWTGDTLASEKPKQHFLFDKKGPESLL